MATLHVRNIPDALYKRLQRRAKQENRSLSAEVIQLLEQAEKNAARQSKISDALGYINRHRVIPTSGMPDPMQHLHDDRKR